MLDGGRALSPLPPLFTHVSGSVYFVFIYFLRKVESVERGGPDRGPAAARKLDDSIDDVVRFLIPVRYVPRLGNGKLTRIASVRRKRKRCSCSKRFIREIPPWLLQTFLATTQTSWHTFEMAPSWDLVAHFGPILLSRIVPPFCSRLSNESPDECKQDALSQKHSYDGIVILQALSRRKLEVFFFLNNFWLTIEHFLLMIN